MSAWQEWLHHPEKLWLRRCLFYIHLCVGTEGSVYIVLMSLSGSMIVYRNELESSVPSSLNSIEWLVNFHANLLSGTRGRFVNGIGAICVLSLCFTGIVIWWPGVGHWRRSLTVNWKTTLARFNWDVHSALGFWSFLFILMWGLSAFYFAFPKVVNALFSVLGLSDRTTQNIGGPLSLAHFGRYGLVSERLWTLLGLVPAILSVTGIFLCCRRMIHGTIANAAPPTNRP